MGKTKMQSLFDLIKSMDRTEKRYFAIQSEFHELEFKGYMELFHFLDKKIEYNQIEIRKFLDLNGIKGNIEPFLIDKILIALRSYHRKRNLQFKVDTYLENVEILMGKGVVDLAKKELLAAKRLANRSNLLAAKLRIINVELNFKELNSFQNSDRENLEIFGQEINELESEISSRLTYLWGFHLIRTYFLNNAGDKDLTDYIDTNISQILTTDSKVVKIRADNIQNEVYLNYLDSNYEIQFKNESNSLEPIYRKYGILVDKFIESKDKELIRNNFNLFTSVLNSYLLSCIHTGDFSSFFKYIANLKNAIRLYKPTLINYKYLLAGTEGMACYLEIVALCRQKKYEEVIVLIPEVKKQAKKHKKCLPVIHHALLEYWPMLACFYAENHDLCLVYINDLLDRPIIKENPIAHSTILMIEILCFINIKSFKLIPSLSRRANYYFKKNNLFKDFEKEFLKLVNKFQKYNEKEHQIIFASAQERFSKIPNQYAILGFDLMEWIEIKIA